MPRDAASAAGRSRSPTARRFAGSRDPKGASFASRSTRARSIERFDLREPEGRALRDLGDVARAATYGAIDTVLVDIDEVVPGSVDEQSGAVTLSGTTGADRYGVVDEIARRAWLAGGRVLAVRRDDVPGEGPVAAILRYPI